MKVVLFFCLFLLTLSQNELPQGECDDDPTCVAYTKALAKTKYPTSSRIVKSLTKIRPDNQNLVFDSEGRVLLASSDKINRFVYSPGEKFVLKEDMWFTAYPDLQNSCRKYPVFDKTARMVQQLGLSPIDDITGVVEVFVSLSDIFRPCADPEISDSECVVSVPIFNNNSAQPNNPFYCARPGEEILQIGAKWAKVSQEHFQWMCENWKVSFENPDVYKNYPWTGLGYTFDWGNNDGIGLSEFVVPAGVEVVFRQKLSIDQYCENLSEEENIS